MKKLSATALVLLALLLSLLSAGIRAEVLGVAETETGTGWLERDDQGDLILHLAGSYYDMGRQQAQLLREETEMVIRASRHSLRRQVPFLPPSWVIGAIHHFIYAKAAPFIPQEFREEMQGLADQSGAPLKLIQAGQAITYLTTNCANAAAWGAATADGELYFARSNDAFVMIDPATDQSYHDRSVIVIYRPLQGIPYLMVSWPGNLGASDGMNAEGIAVGNLTDRSKSSTPAGVPMLFRLKQTLASARTLDEAVSWMSREPLEGGYNFLVVDAKIPAARAMEMDARSVYVGAWDGPAESNRYTYQGREYAYEPTRDLLLRTNHPLSSELIARHRGPIDERQPNDRITGSRYRDLRARLLEKYGALDLESMNAIIRDHYAAMTYSEEPTLGATTYQVVLAPKSGDILIAFCQGNPLKLGRRQVSAFSQPYHRYNFFDLLNRTPPEK